MKKVLYRYRFFTASLTALLLLLIFNTSLAVRSVEVTAFSLREMLLFIPPIFVLLGLLDVWVPRETMVRFMGPGSGIMGTVLAFAMGSATAGPLYGAFPVAAVLLKKGAGFRNVFIFIGAWSTTKVPMLLFEIQSLGLKFALTRLLVNIPGIIIIAWILVPLIGTRGQAEILRRVESLEKR